MAGIACLLIMMLSTLEPEDKEQDAPSEEKEVAPK